jgi:hypothetical protein
VTVGALAAGALGAALAVGGAAAYAADGTDLDGGQQVVRVVEDDGGATGRDCPDKGEGGSNNEESSTGGDGL